MECMLRKGTLEEFKEYISNNDYQADHSIHHIWIVSKPDFDDCVFEEHFDGMFCCTVYNESEYTGLLSEILEFINKTWWGD